VTTQSGYGFNLLSCSKQPLSEFRLKKASVGKTLSRRRGHSSCGGQGEENLRQAAARLPRYAKRPRRVMLQKTPSSYHHQDTRAGNPPRWTFVASRELNCMGFETTFIVRPKSPSCSQAYRHPTRASTGPTERVSSIMASHSVGNRFRPGAIEYNYCADRYQLGPKR